MQSSWASEVALVVKNLPVSSGDIRDLGLIPGSGRFPGGGNGNALLQYSCLENPHGQRRAWRAIVHRVAKSQTWLKWLNIYALYALQFIPGFELLLLFLLLSRTKKNGCLSLCFLWTVSDQVSFVCFGKRRTEQTIFLPSLFSLGVKLTTHQTVQ